MSEALEHETDHRDSDHRLGNLGQLLVVLGEAAPSSEPSEGSFNDPAAWQDDEAGPGDAAHDDERQAEQEAGEQDRDPVVDAVGEHRSEPAVQRLDPAQQAPRAVGVLDVGGVDDDSQQQTGGVDRDVAFAAPDLLAGIIAARPPFSVVLTVCVSMMAAVGLASRPSRSRSMTTR
jgi:hypothetical protein